MSYCRWSSDNFNCDLYCFEHVDGYWQTYVAGSRHRVWFRIFHWLTDKRLKVSKDWVYRTPRFKTYTWPKWLTHKYIGLPFDGASFQDPTEEEMFWRIRMLADHGYRVPKRLLEQAKEPHHS